MSTTMTREQLEAAAQERDLTPYERGQLRALQRKDPAPLTMPKQGDTLTFGGGGS